MIPNTKNEKIIKPWGEEILFTPSELSYTLKMISVNEGQRLSLQSHTQKVETFVLVSGNIDLVIGPDIDHLETIHMQPQTGYNIEVNTIHRMVGGLGGGVIVEGSTPETGVTVRYQDDYQRPDETEAMRKEKNRGWSPTSNE